MYRNEIREEQVHFFQVPIKAVIINNMTYASPEEAMNDTRSNQC